MLCHEEPVSQKTIQHCGNPRKTDAAFHNDPGLNLEFDSLYLVHMVDRALVTQLSSGKLQVKRMPYTITAS